MRKHNIKNLIEQEKLLYLEVEQLRYRLYLHDESLLFQFFSAFYFTYQDIKKMFNKKKLSNKTPHQLKQQFIHSLQKKKQSLLLLSHTPYAWIVFLARKIKYFLSSRAATRDLYNPPLSSQTQSRKLNKSFLIFGTTSNEDLQSRSVQIAHKIAENHKVICIEGVFDEGSTPGFRITETSEKLTAIRLTAKRQVHFNYQKPTKQEISFLKKSFYLFYNTTIKLSNNVIYIHHPFWDMILSPKKNGFIFDHSDNFAKIYPTAKHIVLAEKNMLKKASLVTAPHRKHLRNKNDKVIENGVDWDIFKDTSKMIQTCDVGLCWIKKPVMGYIGALDEKIDEELIGKLASAFPTASIVLVGNTNYRPVIEVAEKYPNIFPVGNQPYKKLPLFLQSFDILITPFKSFPEGDINHPELPLYLASGKPLLATSQVATYKKFIYSPKTHTEWILSVAEALQEKKRSKKRYLRINTAKKMKWHVKKLT